MAFLLCIGFMDIVTFITDLFCKVEVNNICTGGFGSCHPVTYSLRETTKHQSL